MSARSVKPRSVLLLIILLAAGVLIGGMIASITKGVPALSWLGYAKSFGLDADHPAVIDISVLKITFGCMLRVDVAQVLCLLGAVLLYLRIK